MDDLAEQIRARLHELTAPPEFVFEMTPEQVAEFEALWEEGRRAPIRLMPPRPPAPVELMKAALLAALELHKRCITPCPCPELRAIAAALGIEGQDG